MWNPMTSSSPFKDRIYSKQGSYISLLFETWTNHQAGAQPGIFQGRGSFVELGDFDKHFVKKNIRKKLEFFLKDTVKTTF